MAKLTLYTDKTVMSHVARQTLQEKNIDFDEIYIEENDQARSWLDSKRNLVYYPCPQFYVDHTLAFENVQEVIAKSEIEINQRVEEINAAI